MKQLLLENFLPYRLARLSEAVSQRLKHVYGEKYGLTVPEWRVLATLGQAELLTAKQVGTHSAMHKTKVSRAVAELERRRWLRRISREEDRREELLSLTPLGARTYAMICPEMLSFVDAIETRLGREGVEALQASFALLEWCLGVPGSRSPAAPGNRTPTTPPGSRRRRD